MPVYVANFTLLRSLVCRFIHAVNILRKKMSRIQLPRSQLLI